MDIFDRNPQGYWKVGDQKFINKINALKHATETKTYPTFHYFDSVFSNFDTSQLGKFTLDQLYAQRAKQLRDKYDYLILYFSGGADSYNILRTFLDNNIHLDEVCVKWPKKVLEANIEVYKPNTLDTSAYNYLSEWDYAIKPVLDSLAQTHPNIKIEIVDWLPDVNMNLESCFETVQHWHDIEVPSLAVWSPSEEKLVSQGKTVGSIYGADKPYVYFGESTISMMFMDSAFAMGTSNPCNIYGAEFFYWTPDLPALPFEMANQVTKWYLANPHYINICGWKDDNFLSYVSTTYTYRLQQQLYRSILYTTWDNKFQADKPLKDERTDKQQWITRLPELKEYREQFIAIKDSYVSQIHRTSYHMDSRRPMYYSLFTKAYNLTTHNLKDYT
jgi:hypothetical protein